MSSKKKPENSQPDNAKNNTKKTLSTNNSNQNSKVQKKTVTGPKTKEDEKKQLKRTAPDTGPKTKEDEKKQLKRTAPDTGPKTKEDEKKQLKRTAPDTGPNTKEDEKKHLKRTNAPERTNPTSKYEKLNLPSSLRNESKRLSESPSTSKTKVTIPTKKVDTRTTLSKTQTTNRGPIKNGPVKNTKPIPKKIQESSKPNKVMTSIHNVTVLSPPLKRKDIDNIIMTHTISAIEDPPSMEKLERPRTRTLSRSRVLPLEYSSGGADIATPTINLKEPVAFEVVFPQKDNSKSTVRLVKDLSETHSDAEESGSQDYADDFESYESDFETGSSTFSNISNKSSSSDISAGNLNNSSINTDEDDSEETQLPITVIHREKENERKLDSGNFDISSKSRQLSTPQPCSDSLDIINNEQLDSGFSYSFLPKSTESVGVTYGGRKDFLKSTKLSKRGKELMKKIQLDTISISIFDAKSIGYEQYMRVYGKLNADQSSTQTNDNNMNTDSQTDALQMRTVWTQHPPNYNLEEVFNKTNFGPNRNNFFGEIFETEETKNGNKLMVPNILEESLQAIQTFRRVKMNYTIENHKQIDFNRLNEFLNRSSIVISKIVNKSSNRKRNWKSSCLGETVSEGFYQLDTKFLNALRVVRIFSNPRLNTILTVHESIADVYKSDFSNLIMVWNTIEATKPIRLLSSWSEVCRADICNEKPDIIVCGLRDGTIAMWDLRDTNSFCSKLDGYLTLFPATQSITPSWGGTNFQLNDLGAVVDIKSFRLPDKNYKSTNYKTIQFVSLNETGILTIWTLLKTEKKNYENINDRSQQLTEKFEYLSPWAKVKLIQSAIYDLREYLELKNVRPTSGFDLAKSNFEKDIFNDHVLKELNETRINVKLGLQGLRFTNLDTGVESIFIGTNRNYIITCSKTLKTERFRKIFIDNSKFLFPTALRLLINENFLAVGLSNGSVIILNCNKNLSSDRQSLNKNEVDSVSFEELSYESDAGKSCAIQNIIRNERRINGDEINLHSSDRKLINNDNIVNDTKTIDYRIFDHQILLCGSVLRKDLVQSIEISQDGRRLFALSDGGIRTYDFFSENEISCSSSIKIQEISVANDQGNKQSLILLTNDDNIQVHLLK